MSSISAVSGLAVRRQRPSSNSRNTAPPPRSPSASDGSSGARCPNQPLAGGAVAPFGGGAPRYGATGNALNMHPKQITAILCSSVNLLSKRDAAEVLFNESSTNSISIAVLNATQSTIPRLTNITSINVAVRAPKFLDDPRCQSIEQNMINTLQTSANNIVLAQRRTLDRTERNSIFRSQKRFPWPSGALAYGAKPAALYDPPRPDHARSPAKIKQLGLGSAPAPSAKYRR